MAYYNNKCLYVKGLNRSTTAEDLKRIFERAGGVNDAKKLSPATALVDFRQINSAKKAIELFEGTVVHGNTIHVSYKTNKRNKQSENSASSTGCEGREGSRDSNQGREGSRDSNQGREGSRDSNEGREGSRDSNQASCPPVNFHRSRSVSISNSASSDNESESSTNLFTADGANESHRSKGRGRGGGRSRCRSYRGRGGRGMHSSLHRSGSLQSLTTFQQPQDGDQPSQSVGQDIDRRVQRGTNLHRRGGRDRRHGGGRPRRFISVQDEDNHSLADDNTKTDDSLSSLSKKLNELYNKGKNAPHNSSVSGPESPEDLQSECEETSYVDDWLSNASQSDHQQSVQDVGGGFSRAEANRQYNNKRSRHRNRRRGAGRKDSNFPREIDRFSTDSCGPWNSSCIDIDISDLRSQAESHSSSPSEPEVNEDVESTYTDTRNMDLDRLRYMVARKMKFRLMKTTGVEISINLDGSSLTAKGTKSKVVNAFIEIMSQAEVFATIETSVSKVFSMCFRSVKAGDIVEAFKHSYVYAGWQLRDEALHICCDTLQNANLALELIKELVREREYPEKGELSGAEVNCITREPGWGRFLAKLKGRYQSHSLQLHYAESLKRIQFALKSPGSTSVVAEDLQVFFKPLNNLQRTITIETHIGNLLLINKDYCLNHCSEEGVTLDIDQIKLNGSCTLTSQSVKSLDSAVEKLNKLIAHRVTKAMVCSKPGHLAWLRSPVGIRNLQDTNALSHTVSLTAFRKSAHPLNLSARHQSSAAPTMYRRIQTSDPTRSSPLKPSPVSAKLVDQMERPILSLFKHLFRPNLSTLESAAAYASVAVAGVALVSTAATYKSSTEFIPPTPSVTFQLFDKVKIVGGDISSVQADGLVSSQGVIARSIEQKSGSRLIEGHQITHMMRGMRRTAVSVYHLSTEHWNNTDERLKQFVDNIRAAYQALRKSQVIAIPCIGTGGLGYPIDKVASMMIGTVLDCLKTSPSSTIQTVMFVIHESATEAHQAFVTELSKYQPDIVDVPLTVPVFSRGEEARVTFTGLRQGDVDKAIKRLYDDLECNMAKVDWSTAPQRAAIQQLTQREINDIFDKAVAKNVEISFDPPKEIINLEGLKDDVNSLRDEINHVLHRKSTLPLHWDQTAKDREQCQVIIDRHSREFEEVAQKFREGCPTGTHITEILRIQNEELHTQYQAQKNKVARELGGNNAVLVENTLWHGTSAESCKQICAHGFNRSFAGKHAVAYGQGTYFSTSSEYSVRYSDGERNKCIILAKVVVGRYKLGNSDTTRKNLPPEYHSTTNSNIKPSIFVVYHDAAAYPEYVIRFDKLGAS